MGGADPFRFCSVLGCSGGGGSANSQTWCHRHFPSLIWAGKHKELIKGKGEMTSTSQGLSFPAPVRPGPPETSKFIKYAAILKSWSTCTCMVQYFNCYNFLQSFLSDSDDDEGHLMDWWWDASHPGFLTFLHFRPKWMKWNYRTCSFWFTSTWLLSGSL